MITKEQAIDIVEKFEFFYGQRSGKKIGSTLKNTGKNNHYFIV